MTRAEERYVAQWEWVMCGRLSPELMDGPGVYDGIATWRAHLAAETRGRVATGADWYDDARAALPPLRGWCACGHKLPLGPWPYAECPTCRAASLGAATRKEVARLRATRETEMAQDRARAHRPSLYGHGPGQIVPRPLRRDDAGVSDPLWEALSGAAQLIAVLAVLGLLVYLGGRWG